MDRRRFLSLAGLAAGAAPLSALAGRSAAGSSPASPASTPALFLAHGSPFLLDDAAWMGELSAWAAALPRPRAILMVSAHWEERPLTIGATRAAPLVYDFSGFPARYYQVQYPAPGAPELAARVKGLLSAAGRPVAEDPSRGLDHGAYVPLIAMYPRADVPVLQVSLPTLDPAELLLVGRALAPLRDEGVLVVGSGFLSHDLRRIDTSPHPRTPQWASEFDAWAADAIARRDVDEVLDYRKRAPGVALALPTHEHFAPLLVTLGAAADETRVTFPITGFHLGTLTRRSVQLGG